MSHRSSALAALAVIAFALPLSTRAEAKPTIQVINTIPIGTSPLLQSPYQPWFDDLNDPAVTFDADPSSPWIVEIGNQFTPGGATVTRIGTPGLAPASASFTPFSFTATDAHADVIAATMPDDYVYLFDARTGECIWKTYLGRTIATTINFPGCVGGVAPVDIQCPNESDGQGGSILAADPQDPNAYPIGAASSLVYVATNYASAAAGDDPDFCGTTTDNRLYALRGDTGAPAWVFNTDPTSPTPYAGTDNPRYLVNGIAGGASYDIGWDWCSAGTGRQEVLLGTADPGTGQPTLFAVSTAPAKAGQLNWSGAMGDIQMYPSTYLGFSKTNCEHAYVATNATGLLESIGITPAACGKSAVPCLLSSLPLFPFSPFNGMYSWWLADNTNSLYSKLVVADQNTIRIVTDDGKKLSTYCTATALQSSFPTLGPSPLGIGSSVWTGAMDRSGNGALVGLEIPLTPPGPPYDCGTSFTSLPLKGTPGSVTTDIDPTTNARVIYIADDGPDGSELILTNFTE